MGARLGLAPPSPGERTAAGAAIGTGLGAASGALIGLATGDAEAGAAIGAASGLLLGTAGGASHGAYVGSSLQRRYDIACLTTSRRRALLAAVNPSRAMLAGLRRQDWAFFAMMFCAGGALTSAAIGDPLLIPVGYAGAALVAGALARRFSRRYPAPMPHALRWLLHVSHPGLSPQALHRVLAPRSGERMLEIGPGIGHHALPTARALAPAGRLDVLDLQPAMLVDLEQRAERAGVRNIVASQGDAEHLPHPDATFDAAYLVTVLGEIPHPDAALRELARVVRRGGRVVVGELFLDPDYVSPARMRGLAAASGLAFGAQVGTRLAYFARLEVPGASA